MMECEWGGEREREVSFILLIYFFIIFYYYFYYYFFLLRHKSLGIQPHTMKQKKNNSNRNKQNYM